MQIVLMKLIFINLTATLSVATTADVTVTIGTSGTATEGTDYTDGVEISMILLLQLAIQQTISFKPTDDSVYEGDETATISIDSVSGGSIRKRNTSCYNNNIRK